MNDKVESESGVKSGDAQKSSGGDDVPPWSRATLEDVAGLEFEAPIAGSNAADCHDLRDAFHKVLPQGDERRDDAASRVFTMLSAVTGMLFKPGDHNAPYGPMAVWADGRRTAIPEDFRGQPLEPMAEMAARATHPTFKARLSDVCWLLDRKLHQLGRAAVASYVEVVRRVQLGALSFRFEEDDGGLAHGAYENLRRALHIARKVGWDGPEATAAREITIELRKQAVGGGKQNAIRWFSELDLDFSLSDPAEVAGDIEAALREEGRDRNRHRDIGQLRLASRGYHLAKREDDKHRCRLLVVEALEAEAESHGSAMLQAHWLSAAIAELHGVPNQAEKRRELRHRLVDVQAHVPDEMSVFSHPMDLTDMVETITGHFEPLNLRDKLFAFAALSESPDPEKLAEEAAEMIREHPLSSIFGVSLMDAEGKVIHRTEGSGHGGGGDDPAIAHQISQAERIRREVLVSGSVEIARRTINDQHYVSDDILSVLLDQSPFVPRDLLVTFSRGLANFFQGDFISAVYILTPLLENSLRHVLKQSEFDVSTFDDATQTQEDRTLSGLFEHMRSELDQVFSTAITTDIYNVFLSKSGPALRSRVAHGLLHDGSPFSADAIYACWLIFHLALIPLFAHREEIVLDA